jgi:plasmid stabilization system protein ParE
MKLRFSPRAKRDIDEISEYLNERSPGGARNVLQHIYLALQFIALHPEASQKTEDAAVCVKIVSRNRY